MVDFFNCTWSNLADVTGKMGSCLKILGQLHGNGRFLVGETQFLLESDIKTTASVSIRQFKIRDSGSPDYETGRSFMTANWQQFNYESSSRHESHDAPNIFQIFEFICDRANWQRAS